MGEELFLSVLSSDHFCAKYLMNEIIPPYTIPECYLTAADGGKVLSKAFSSQRYGETTTEAVGLRHWISET